MLCPNEPTLPGLNTVAPKQFRMDDPMSSPALEFLFGTNDLTKIRDLDRPLSWSDFLDHVMSSPISG